MAYTLMLKAIEAGKQTKQTLLKKANVYYMADQLTDEQYEDVIARINAM